MNIGLREMAFSCTSITLLPKQHFLTSEKLMFLFSVFQPEIRVGAVALLGNENSPLLNTAAQYLIEAVLGISAVMEQHQPAPRLPPSPTDYVGVYVHKSDVSDLQVQQLGFHDTNFSSTPHSLN